MNLINHVLRALGLATITQATRDDSGHAVIDPDAKTRVHVTKDA